ncbi:hypothetical protein BV898_09483 [Hypsibius exemplaris]|uniref:Receptor ligand binding region domain-containing protein n=1 Tax=Hypsibius exemplaris TaxID=2072580 RepID=A0A1W0WMF1_HYPEX|nr:hypothetical protein BV898_09483 [Hypsibius exemplaris]
MAAAAAGATSSLLPAAEVPARSVEIVSPGLLWTVDNAVASTLGLAGPAFDVSIAALRRNLHCSFNISHTYLYEEDIVDCGTLQNEVQDILARWYYKVHREESMAAVITPGCIESAQINQLVAEWNVLFISTSNSDSTIHDDEKSPTWITTNLYPSSYYGIIFVRLLQRHKWTSVEILRDDSSTAFYSLVAQLTRQCLNVQRIRTVFSSYTSGNGTQPFNFPTFLRQFSTRNRVLLFLGPAKQLRLLLVSFMGSGSLYRQSKRKLI